VESIFNPINKEEFDELIEIKVIDSVDEGFETYVSGILDVRESAPTEEELGSIPFGVIEDYNILYEERFIQFIRRVQDENRGERNFVDCYLKEAHSGGLLTALELLDYKDKLVFLELLRKGIDDNPYLELNDKIVELMLKLSTREILFTTMFYRERPITIWGNYDMAFPVFFKSEEDKEYYSEIARECGLYIREM
jgi:hypothetical protein